MPKFLLELKAELLESQEFLFRYIRHPVQQITKIPDWSWKRLLTIQAVLTMLTGALSGIVSLSVFSVVQQIIMTPILTLITISVSSLFFYYTFQIFAEKTVAFRSIFSVVLFANIPFFIFQIVSAYFSLISMVGFAFTALLLIVAFVDSFKISKSLVLKLIGALYVLFLGVWIMSRIDGSRIDKTWKSEKIQAPEVKLGE